jgi:hypothetical protein
MVEKSEKLIVVLGWISHYLSKETAFVPGFHHVAFGSGQGF